MRTPASVPRPHAAEGPVEHYFALLAADDATAAVEFARATEYAGLLRRRKDLIRAGLAD